MGTGPSSAFFQMGFDAAAGDGLVIEPYPEVEQPDRDAEGQSIDLLYRKKRTYAIGHGCAADWGAGTEESVAWVRAEPLPAYEVVSLTPNVYLRDGAGARVAVTVSMEELANETAVGRDQVETVLRRASTRSGSQPATRRSLTCRPAFKPPPTSTWSVAAKPH